ncbi:hypothetical protein HII31_08142, partial [Pseudocercospora fuligena]
MFLRRAAPALAKRAVLRQPMIQRSLAVSARKSTPMPPERKRRTEQEKGLTDNTAFGCESESMSAALVAQLIRTL